MMKKYVIVGGVAGGATAAARLRRLQEDAEIILLERGKDISFANCGLPYYVGDVIQTRERLLVQTAEQFWQQYRVEVRVESEVIGLDAAKKCVVVRSLDQGIYEESYDALLLAPGAKPMRPPIPGIQQAGIVSLRNMADADALRALADQYAGNGRAVVVGGGFIGIEAAENLRSRGLSVTIVEAAPHILAPFDTDMVKYAEQELNAHGIGLLLGSGVTAFQPAEDGIRVELADGQQRTVDFVVLAIGVQPDTGFLQDTGLELGPRGHILVDAGMRTNLPDIYAVGDAVLTQSMQTGEPAALALAGPANRQGRLAADNMAGAGRDYTGVQGTSILKVFALTAAATGRNERSLQRAGMVRDQDYWSVKLHPFHHASYYPGADMLHMKLLFARDGRILGAQIMGGAGVDKRIDTIAAAMRLGASAEQLAELELAYAPPFASAKDPVNMAGYMAENVLAGRVVSLQPEELSEALAQGARLLDVRTPLEYAGGHLETAENMPLGTLRQQLDQLDPAQPVVVYCKVGLRGYLAACILQQHGFQVKNLSGGYLSWQSESYVADGTAAPAAEAAGPAKQPELASSAQTVQRAETSAAVLDLTGLSCPGPLMQLQQHVAKQPAGTVIEAVASDPGFFADCAAWCKSTGHTLLSREKRDGKVYVKVQKKAEGLQPAGETADSPVPAAEARDHKTIVVFSGDLDRALASFVIANGAAAMGKKVTMFFTFWGLNILRKEEPVPVRKGFIDRMFGWMMPRGSKKLALSKLHMFGLGTKLMRRVMQEKKIASLEDLMQSAQAAGIEMIACQMSMDVMGIRAEELIDGVTPGGVGAYLGAAEEANVNLFI